MQLLKIIHLDNNDIKTEWKRYTVLNDASIQLNDTHEVIKTDNLYDDKTFIVSHKTLFKLSKNEIKLTDSKERYSKNNTEITDLLQIINYLTTKNILNRKPAKMLVLILAVQLLLALKILYGAVKCQGV